MRSKIDRRAFLSAVGGATAVAVSSSVAQTTSPPKTRTKGPIVWLDMDQKELDDAYTQSVYAPNMQQVLGRTNKLGLAMRERLGQPRRYKYGPTPIEGLDVYLTNRPNAPINIFIHGGAWLGGPVVDAFPAEVFVRAGAHSVIVDFINVQDAGGNLTPMADQIRRAVAWIYKNAQMFGGDPNRIFVSGHSSGGHLAAVALTTDWAKDFKLPADVVKGALFACGMFDLKPVRLSIRSTYVKFTDEMEAALSPMRHIDKLNAPIIVVYGTLETPEFQRQSRDFASAVRAAGKPVEVLVGEGYNHFEIQETLGNPYGLLGHAALNQMKLAAR
jgi:arylformamidase